MNAEKPFRLAVVGGGITGLAAAHRAIELARDRSFPLELHLFEASPRVGGVLQTLAADGLLMESGPDCFLSEKPAALNLCRRLGIADQIIETSPACRRSFIARGKRLIPVPPGFYLLAPTQLRSLLATPLFSWPGKLRMAMDLFLPRKRAPGEESLAQFVRRRLGREALDRMAQPMVAGIYAADPEQLSLEATFPRFLELERTYGSVIRGLRRNGSSARTAQASGPRYSLFLSFREGMQTLIHALEKQIPPSAIHKNCAVQQIVPLTPEGAWRILTPQGQTFVADAVCLALPAPVAARLLRSVEPSLAQLLESIPYNDSATLNLVYNRQDVPHPLDGFGFVVPAVEHRTIIGCTFTSTKFEGRTPKEKVSLRVFLGGATPAEWMNKDDADLIQGALKDLQDLLGISQEPQSVWLSRHRQSMPQYTLGHLDRIRQIDEKIKTRPGAPPLALAGNAYHGIGVPDCIASGEQAAETLLIQRVPV